MLDKFYKNFNAAIEEIESVLNTPGDAYDYEMVSLVKWMLCTDANPYSYLPNEWASAIYSAESFVSLISHIHHALYDDGDITFVSVNNEPRIVFADRCDKNFNERALNNTEKGIAGHCSNYSIHYDIKVLDITPDQFGAIYDEYQKNWLKKCFISDSIHGIEFAAGIYRKYKLWNEDWLNEVKGIK